MAMNVDRTLRLALRKLTSERARIDRQVAALENVLSLDERRKRSRGPTRKTRARKRMGPTARKAASRRMKAYWKKRRAKTAKQGRKSAK